MNPDTIRAQVAASKNLAAQSSHVEATASYLIKKFSQLSVNQNPEAHQRACTFTMERLAMNGDFLRADAGGKAQLIERLYDGFVKAPPPARDTAFNHTRHTRRTDKSPPRLRE